MSPFAASSNGRQFVATTKSIDVLVEGTLVDTVPMTDVTATAIAAAGSIVAVGNDNHKVEIYSVGADNKFRLTQELQDSTDSRLRFVLLLLLANKRLRTPSQESHFAHQSMHCTIVPNALYFRTRWLLNFKPFLTMHCID